MERLTTHICGHAHGAEGLRDDNLTGNYCRGEFEATAIVDRLSAIEDILGDEYDLDRLRELVQADREGRCVVIHPNSVTDNNYKIICRKINAEDIHLRKMRNAYEKHK